MPPSTRNSGVMSPGAKRLQERNKKKLERAIQICATQRDLFTSLASQAESDEEGSQKIGATQDREQGDVRELSERDELSQDLSPSISTMGTNHQDEHLHDLEDGALQPPAPTGASKGKSGCHGQDDPRITLEQLTGESPTVNQSEGGQLLLSPKQKARRNTWTETDQKALIDLVIAHKPFVRALKKAERKSKWNQIIATMQIRPNMKHVLTEHAVRQKFCFILQWAKEARNHDERATGAREEGQYSPLMRACIDLQSLMDGEEAKVRVRDTAAQKVKGIMTEGAAYQARLASTPPPIHQPKKKARQSLDDDGGDDFYFPNRRGHHSPTVNQGSPDQFVHGSNAVFQAAYAHLARGPSPTSQTAITGDNQQGVIDFLRDQAREQREWLVQCQRAHQEAQRASQEAQKEAQRVNQETQRGFQEAMTNLMSIIAGSIHKNG